MYRSIRLTLALFVVAILALTTITAPAWAKNDKARKARIKIMTYNLYVGADIFRVFNPPACGVPEAVSDIYQIIQGNDFPARAEAIADQIMAEGPHVIGLQEVSLLRTQFPGNALAPDGSGIEFLGDFPSDPRFTFKLDAATVELDYLQLLLDALEARGLDYTAVAAASPTNADVEFPAIEFDDLCNPTSIPKDIRLTDQDVILVRGDLPVSLAFEKNFEVNAPIELPTLIPTPGGLVPAVYVSELTRGWGAAVLTIKDQTYTVFNTHLEVGDETLPPDVGLNLVQLVQALELGQARTSFPTPRLVIGDINSSPASGFTDPRLAYFVLTQSFGMADVWTIQTKPKDDPGFTCCQSETLDNVSSELDERIDVVLTDFGSLVPEKIKTQVMGEEAEDKTPSGLWPSDHAGVEAKLSFER